MKLTKEERQALERFNWKINTRTKHNWHHVKIDKRFKKKVLKLNGKKYTKEEDKIIREGYKENYMIDLHSAYELQHILDCWNDTKKKLNIKLRNIL